MIFAILEEWFLARKKSDAQEKPKALSNFEVFLPDTTISEDFKQLFRKTKKKLFSKK